MELTAKLAVIVGLLACVFISNRVVFANRRISCYDYDGRAQRCIPPFVNAAFNMPVDATNTCGERRQPTRFCVQTGVTGARKYCDFCDDRDPYKSHPAKYLTDFNDQNNLTWWQSETMLERVQFPNSVNLTLNLGKAFEVTYVRLKFRSSRPESFAIYKKTNPSGEWIPWQYYSGSCFHTYGRYSDEIITRDNEAKAICIKELSDISPLTGGSVAFSTLEGRPSAYNFEGSSVLQEWVTATDIMIVLNRMNTFGDEVFRDPKVLQSYFYAITDFAVGGRCKCSGHASECVRAQGQNLREQLVCRCEHHTQGPSCNECAPFYNDRPWGRATAKDAHECKKCNCNGRSETCYFDPELYEQTGHGGHCTDCQGNTEGVNCERCKPNHYRQSSTEDCRPCQCSPTGSEDLRCDSTGRCRCKPGVDGEKCDRCAPNYFDFGPDGCRPCACVPDGSLNNDPRCRPNTGVCTCKEFVEGVNCDRCKPGYFGLDGEDPLGCQACFCYGHSSVCSSSPGYIASNVESTFSSGRQKWTAADRSGTPIKISYFGITQNIGVSSTGRTMSYFVAPEKYLGDQRFSYNRFLRFQLNIGEPSARASVEDIVIEGSGMRITTHIFAQRNPLPRTLKEEFKFRLHEHTSYQWTPRLSSTDFIKILSNITSIKIRGTYAEDGVGFIDNVILDSAEVRRNGGVDVNNIEHCTCPAGYIGQFCESCAPGYHREVPYGGPATKCVPCNCNGHSDTCDQETGRCICEHNTIGDHCEKCAPGYYGYALRGTPDDCQKCPCPDDGECVELPNGEIACLNCRDGYTGNLCDQCADGFYGDPRGRYGDPTPCVRCACNGNIDFNAVGNCNSTTGVCLKCIYSTGNGQCQDCLPGYYGDALALPKGQCKPCNCYPPGSIRPDSGPITCSRDEGQCNCQPNVIGRTCDKCVDGTWNIASGDGCDDCDCNRVGSLNNSCSVSTGQCHCKPGVGGQRCDTCQQYHYGFSEEGCKACNCDPDGSRSLQCDEDTGMCDCNENIVGPRCNQCAENKFNISAGCIDCPACYSLVQERVNIHRINLKELRELIIDIGENPRTVNDTDFKKRLMKVNVTVVQLLNDAKSAVGSSGPVADQVKKLNQQITTIINIVHSIDIKINHTHTSVKANRADLEKIKEMIDKTEVEINELTVYLESEGYAALEQAIDAQKKFGQTSNRMTEIARQARTLADKHEKDAMRIEEVSHSALNTSRDALALAKKVLAQPMQTATHIENITLNVRSTEELYNITREKAVNASSESNKAFQDALDLVNDVENIEVPQVSVDTLVSSAKDISKEAVEVKQKADELIINNQELLKNVNEERKTATELLEEGGRQQQVVDELLGDVDAAHGQALDAVKLAEDTLKDAQTTLKELKEFDQMVENSKKQAEEAMKKIPEIEANINDAETNTQEARDNLAGAEADARMANDNSKMAMETANAASTDASTVRQGAAESKEEATKLHNETISLSAQSNDIEKRVVQLEEKAVEDEALIKDAYTKAGQAKASATDSTTRVNEALQVVELIIRELSSMTTVNMTAITVLEQGLAKAESDIAEAQLEERYLALADRHASQEGMIRAYSDDLIDLRKEVQIVRNINETIPRQCYKPGKVEPTLPPNPVG